MKKQTFVREIQFNYVNKFDYRKIIFFLRINSGVWGQERMSLESKIIFTGDLIKTAILAHLTIVNKY